MRVILTALMFVVATCIYPAGQLEDAQAPHVEWKGQGPRPFSAAWLERGIAAFMMACTPGAKVTKEQEKWGLEMLYYYRGMIDGINFSVLFYQSKEESSKLHFPDDPARNLKIAGPQILQFMKDNQASIKPTSDSSRVIIGWYLSRHPQSGEFEKVISRDIIITKD